MSLCQCGCGLPAPLARQNETKRGYVKGQPARFIVGHNWRASLRPSKAIYLRADRHQPVHVVLATKALGRPLPSGAEVHHLDENPRNNDPSNLVICPSKAYHKLLHARARIVRAGGNPNTDRFCGKCKSVKLVAEFWPCSRTQLGTQNTCKACLRKAPLDERVA